MSLRLRLTLLYTSILGVGVLVFGVLVYPLIPVTLLDSIDSRLETASQQIVDRLRINSTDQFDPRSVAGYQPTENLLFQGGDMHVNLNLTPPVGLLDALGENGLGVGQFFYA